MFRNLQAWLFSTNNLRYEREPKFIFNYLSHINPNLNSTLKWSGQKPWGPHKKLKCLERNPPHPPLSRTTLGWWGPSSYWKARQVGPLSLPLTSAWGLRFCTSGNVSQPPRCLPWSKPHTQMKGKINWSSFLWVLIPSEPHVTSCLDVPS